jgi:hypothetical protein
VIGGYVMPVVAPHYAGLSFIVSAVLALVVILWWLLFSRARWYERIGAIVLIAAAAFAEKYVVHPSISGGGMGNMAYILVVPTLTVALVAWALVSRRLSPGAPRGGRRGRRAGLPAVDAAAHGRHQRRRAVGSALALVDDARGAAARAERRRPKTAVPRRPCRRPPCRRRSPAHRRASGDGRVRDTAAGMKAPAVAAKAEPAAPAAAAVPARPAEWPGFRGPDRDGVIRGLQIATDWSQSPPARMWRHDVGPGWSSFAVSGNFFYTQEQRGGDEVVSCYRISTGEAGVAPPRRDALLGVEWRRRPARHADVARRPRLHLRRHGAAERARRGDRRRGVVAQRGGRHAREDADVGFSSSPARRQRRRDRRHRREARRLRHRRAARSSGPAAAAASATARRTLATIDGVDQVIFMSGPGTVGLAPATGKVLWQYAWEGGAIVQPGLTAEGDVLVNTISMNGGAGMRRIAIAHESRGMDDVRALDVERAQAVLQRLRRARGYAYGFDNNILSCIDLKDGTRKWKGGRYGNGQLVLLADQHLLLVLSEEGDLALVKAAPDQFTEVARFAGALEGKTWNHPVLVRDVLLVRNDHEMSAFRLTREHP